jgi:signal peptidase I
MEFHERRFYHGKSMVGTFKPGDGLKLHIFSLAELRQGDVIIFRNIQTIELVHRVVKVGKIELKTRGDNNLIADDVPVTENNIVGKVTHYERNGKWHRVWNGRPGRMRGIVLHGRLHVIRAAKFFLRKPYRLLKKTGIVARLWRPEIEVIRFATPDGPLVKFVHNGRTVASCWTAANSWWFRRPYDFIIDPKAKP